MRDAAAVLHLQSHHVPNTDAHNKHAHVGKEECTFLHPS